MEKQILNRSKRINGKTIPPVRTLSRSNAINKTNFNTKALERNPNVIRLKKMMNANTVVLSDENLDVLLNALLGAPGKSYVSEILKIGGIHVGSRVNDPKVEKYTISTNNFQKIRNYSDAPSHKKELGKQINALLKIQHQAGKLNLSKDPKNELNRLKKEYNGYKEAIYITTRDNIIIAKITIKPPGTSWFNYTMSLGTPDTTIKIELNSKYLTDSMKQKLRKMNITTILKISEITNNAFENGLKQLKNELKSYNNLRGKTDEEIKKHTVDEIKNTKIKQIDHLPFYKPLGAYQLVYNANGKDKYKYVSVSVEKLKNKINISGTNNAKR